MTVGIFELYQSNQWWEIKRKVDGDGLIKLPEVGELKVAGLKRSDVEQVITNAFEKVITNPKIDVEFELAPSAADLEALHRTRESTNPAIQH